MPGKSDPIDATAVALAAIREGLEKLPVAFLDEQAYEIRVLCDYRDQLVSERTKLINRLRWHLVRIAPELEAQLGPAALKGPHIGARLARQLAKLPASPQLRVAKALLERINQISREERELFSELTERLEAHAPQLLERRSIGTVTAAVIVGRTAGARRFRSEGCFARHAGTAPIPASSGKTVRHRLHRGGDRQLNRAITSSPSAEPPGTRRPAPTCSANRPKARPNAKRSAASNATSPARSTTSSTTAAASTPPSSRSLHALPHDTRSTTTFRPRHRPSASPNPPPATPAESPQRYRRATRRTGRLHPPGNPTRQRATSLADPNWRDLSPTNALNGPAATCDTPVDISPDPLRVPQRLKNRK